MDNWEDKIQVKKGNIGENIVTQYLENRGFVVYMPITNKAHGFDRLATKDKKTIMIAEIKSKARLDRYDATGISVSHYHEYKAVSKKYNLPIFIFFVDEKLKEVYGNWLWELEKPDNGFPFVKQFNQETILFSLNNMNTIFKLTNSQCNELKKCTTGRNAKC